MPRGYVKLFQYGSNMNPTRLNAAQRLDGRAKSIGVARLDGWGIRFDLYSVTNRCAVTDIIPAKDEYVLGVLYDVPILFVVARRHLLRHYVPLCLDGALGNAKLVSDLFIQQTGNDQPHDCHVRKGPYAVIQRAIHIHPTVAEYLPTVLSKLEPFAGFR